MMNQQAKYAELGLKTEFLGEGSDQTASERVLRGETQLIFISPENIVLDSKYRNMLTSSNLVEKIVAVAIDEAHCVKTWGDEFRKAFAVIGELRSLLPTSVNLMALTATATIETFQVIVKRLSLNKPILIGLPPNRNNIYYAVDNEKDVYDLTDKLAEEIKTMRCAFSKTVLFVRTYQDCSNIYLLLKKKMGEAFTEPLGFPNMPGHRLVDMYTRVATAEMKKEVLESFCTNGGNLRLIIATTAFGMGIDCPDIRQIIHWGLISNIEDYVQEMGRAGRDGSNSTALLYGSKGSRHANKDIKHYAANSSVCRRRLLFRGFLFHSDNDIDISGCKCCDVCLKSCKCVSCT